MRDLVVSEHQHEGPRVLAYTRPFALLRVTDHYWFECWRDSNGCCFVSITRETTSTRRRKVIFSPQTHVFSRKPSCFAQHPLRIKARPLRISADSERMRTDSLRINAQPICFTYHLLRITSRCAVFRANLRLLPDQTRGTSARSLRNSNHCGGPRPCLHRCHD